MSGTGLLRSPLLGGLLFGCGGGVAAWVAGEPILYHAERLGSLAGLTGVASDKAPALAFAAVLGIYLGSVLGMVEGLMARSHPVFRRGLLLGGLAGLIGGLLGATLGELLLAFTGGGDVARALGWSLFGATLGVGPGLALRNGGRVRRGLLGGAMGGFLGGVLFAGMHVVTGVNLYARALGIPALGLVLGASYALAEKLLRTAWITVLSGKTEGYELTMGSRPILLGGGERADVRLLGDPPVPGVAARIVPDEHGYRLERLDLDLLEVNGSGVETAYLKDGDVIRIRRIRVLFRQKIQGGNPEPERRPAGQAGRAATDPGSPASPGDRPGAGERPGAAPGAPVPAGGAPPPEVRRLIALCGPLAGRVFTLTSDRVTLGREDDNDIVIDEGSISLHHAEILVRGKWTVLIDRGSTNGTFVQDRRITENAIKHGFVVRFGQLSFRFEDPA